MYPPEVPLQVSTPAPEILPSSSKPPLHLPGLLLLCVGVLLLVGVAVLEAAWMRNQPWLEALILPETVLADLPAAETVYTRRLPLENFPDDQMSYDTLAQWGDEPQIKLLREALLGTEHLIVLPVPSQKELAALLESGRLPTPGSSEVLAGQLARLDSFEIEGTRYTVVGRLKPSVAPFLFAYLLPDSPEGDLASLLKDSLTKGTIVYQPDDAFDAQLKAARAALRSVEAATVPAEVPASTQAETAPTGSVPVLGSQIPTRRGFAVGVFIGLLLAVAGGACMTHRFCVYLGQRPRTLTFFREIAHRQRLLLGLHVLLFGALFGSMFAGLVSPLANYRMTRMLSSVFMEGSLSHVGQAYASGNILLAAWATFYNNFILQTLLLTFAISTVPLALGVFKTGMSFVLVGFAMAPLWAGTAGGFTYHSITMVIELEAYVLACFAVIIWPLRLFEGLQYGRLSANIDAAARVFLGAIPVTALLLAAAALYEAVTLILLRF